MCGIAGILDHAHTFDAQMLELRTTAMGDSLRHRGPDDDGVWLDPEAGLGLAHRRLAVIDPTPEGRQPTVSRCERYVLVFNGEIYNFRELARQLATEGHPVDTSSDTVVLREAIAFWGIRKTTESLVGMFAFAVFDRKTRTLSLVRDRVGIKPVYWTHQNGAFVFGSEIKALLASERIEAKRDPSALAAYLQFAYIPAPATIYHNIQKLPPGTILALRKDQEPELETYWDIAQIARTGQGNPVSLADPEVGVQLERLLAQAVTDRMISDVPLGAWLSGGLDSSLVVALMQANSTRKVRTFSIGFPAFGYDEADDARRIAAHLGTDHEEFQVSPQDAMDVISAMPAHYDEPFADSSQIPTYILSHLTRNHVTVALSGDGGDEIFGGYNRYVALPGLARRFAAWPAGLRRALGAIMRAPAPRHWDGLARMVPARTPPQFGDKIAKAASAIAARNEDAAYLSTVSQWPDAHQVVQGQHGSPSAFELEETLSDPVARLQLADTQSYLPDDILTKVDRASMAHALEVRVPLLDHRLVEFAWQLPRADLIAAGRTKLPLRQALARHVPSSLFERPKSGFAIPISDWLRGPLRDWAEELLREDALLESGLLQPGPIRQAWKTHLSGRQNLQNPIWAVLMYQLWGRTAP
ncbi:MAG: asparagine synthase (glutamine-hydrolyzing) [Alphaproteobacteria bacterium]|nr:asparagine synthase (glutamine-hydrolyzing) [Alphaproteobacteria bacterium]